MIPPIVVLAIFVALTLGALGVHLARRSRRAARLRRLAADWQMHFTAGDRFHLADRIPQRLGVPGAASVRVRDVIYGTEGERYRYFFTALYTTGVLRRKVDEAAVCTVTERRQRNDAGMRELGDLSRAGEALSIVDQYAELKRGLSASGGASTAGGTAQEKERDV
jgi:hypothetical protein